ncbi:unnamed protein product [Hyaloperonospora brassicae]|uniref:BZIP domain-containing protein n=1 Tax=Hyaloperonospora brassicae TaxID=162125 RepID=A0AAV0TBL3_HYABA|nr:unnamed protein product [Hyaloperonospora brassicae]
MYAMSRNDVRDVDRRRKQRDLKRLYRERCRAMQTQVAQLERTLDVLLGAHRDTTSPSSRALSLLKEQYATATDELKALRRAAAAAQRKLAKYDGFASSLTVYLADVDAAPAVPAATLALDPLSLPESVSTTDPRARLTLEECQELIKKCYDEIYGRRFHGQSLSSGMHMLGWEDQMFLDGTTVQFSMTKRINGMSAHALMNKTWAILTTAEHMRTIQYSTLGLKVLHKISEDALVLQRCVHHPQLKTVSWNSMVMFRLRCPRGYVLAYQAVDHPAYAKVHTEACSGHEFLWDQDSRPKFSCVKTFQWILFEGDEHLGSGMDSEGFDFELLSSTSDRKGPSFSDVRTDASRRSRRGKSEAREPFQEPSHCASGVKVSYGGKVDNQDASYARFYMFEVLTYIIRWENAVGSARLTF